MPSYGDLADEVEDNLHRKNPLFRDRAIRHLNRVARRIARRVTPNAFITYNDYTMDTRRVEEDLTLPSSVSGDFFDVLKVWVFGEDTGDDGYYLDRLSWQEAHRRWDDHPADEDSSEDSWAGEPSAYTLLSASSATEGAQRSTDSDAQAAFRIRVWPDIDDSWINEGHKMRVFIKFIPNRNTSNESKHDWFTINYPDLLVFGACRDLAIALEDDPSGWAQLFQEEVDNFAAQEFDRDFQENQLYIGVSNRVGENRTHSKEDKLLDDLVT